MNRDRLLEKLNEMVKEEEGMARWETSLVEYTAYHAGVAHGLRAAMDKIMLDLED